jgi:CIC family chloride channel protein
MLAMFVGTIAGAAVIGFREGISFVQLILYGSGSERFFSNQSVEWWQILIVPISGGLLVGLMVQFLLPNKRPEGIADIIKASVQNGGRMSSRVGAAAVIVSTISIGSGASVGREGPAVHLGATLASWIGRRLNLNRSMMRTLLGCGVAAAVAASFNAPIAGTLFASEVIIGHYALRAFAPIVISSVAGTAISRVWFGDFPAFALAETPLASFWEFPAFVALGLTSGIVAIIFMHSILLAQRLSQSTPLPLWIKPAIAGLVVGICGLIFPEVLGVGYGITESALLVEISLSMLLVLAVAKIFATAVSLGWGFSGGVFSPSIVIGALSGGAFGIVVTGLFPEYSSGPAAYTLVGMGAVAAAVLGAPISTTLIIFEMTGDYALMLGVMVAIVSASEISEQVYGRSFFSIQLKKLGIDLRSGFETEIMHTIHLNQVLKTDIELVSTNTSLPSIRALLQNSKNGELFVVQDDGTLFGTISLSDLKEFAFDKTIDDLLCAGDVARPQPSLLCEDDNLEVALKVISETEESRIAVVKDYKNFAFIGYVTKADVVEAYNKALLESRHKEHGD